MFENYLCLPYTSTERRIQVYRVLSWLGLACLLLFLLRPICRNAVQWYTNCVVGKKRQQQQHWHSQHKYDHHIRTTSDVIIFEFYFVYLFIFFSLMIFRLLPIEIRCLVPLCVYTLNVFVLCKNHCAWFQLSRWILSFGANFHGKHYFFVHSSQTPGMFNFRLNIAMRPFTSTTHHNSESTSHM